MNVVDILIFKLRVLLSTIVAHGSELLRMGFRQVGELFVNDFLHVHKEHRIKFVKWIDNQLFTILLGEEGDYMICSIFLLYWKLLNQQYIQQELY